MIQGQQTVPPATQSSQTTQVSPFVTSSAITVTYPAGGEQLQYNTGKDSDFRVNWATSNYSHTVNVYLVSSSGSQCLLGSTSSSNDTFPITIGANFQCANNQLAPTAGQYRVEVSGDDGLGDGKEIGSWSGYFTLSPYAYMVSSSSNSTCGKDVCLSAPSSNTTSTPAVNGYAGEFTASPSSGNAPLTVNFSSTIQSAGDLNIDYGDGSSCSTAENPDSSENCSLYTHTYTQPGQYKVILSRDLPSTELAQLTITVSN
jgi:PKD repeat protein